MDDKFDEIIDLEEEPIEEEVIEETPVEPVSNQVNVRSPKVSPKMPNITKRGKEDLPVGNVLNKNRLANSDKTTPQKLQNIGRNNRSFPPIGGSSFSNQEEEDGLKEKVQDKVGGKAITAATGGAIHGKTAEEVAKLARKTGALDMVNPLKKYKWYLIGGSTFFIFLFILVIIVIPSAFDDKSINHKAATPYVNDEISDDELINELIFYGYCTKSGDCKKTGIYKYYEKLKEINKDYSKECGTTTKLGEKCGVQLNTSLIIETMNYYLNEISPYDSKETGVTEEDLEKEENKNIFSKIVSFFKSQKRINTMLDDTEKLAQAQVEYVEETCKMSEESKAKTTLKYNHISFDKYISYLAYGETSTHPNYQGEPVKIENDICVGPVDDFISTEYQQQNEGYQTDEHGNITKISGSGKGVEIVNYALQFVGNPYVWGGNSLTNGIDCSGFTKAIYGHFGIDLPRKSSEQIHSNGGTVIGRSLNDISKAQPGDLLVWDGHVAIYMGDNKMVHAQSKKTGIVVSGVSSGHSFLGIVRF